MPCQIKHGFVRSKGKCYTYQTILTIDGTSLCMTRGHNGSEIWHPLGEWTIPTNMKSVCTPCHMVWWVRTHCGVVSVAITSDGKQGYLADPVSDVDELELAQVPVERWIIDHYKYGFLDGPGNAMCLSTHNVKTVHIDTASRGLTMFLYGGGDPKMFFKPIPKGPSQFLNVFLFTTCLCAHKHIDHPTFLGDGILFHGSHQRFLIVFPPLKWTCIPTLSCTFLKLSLISLV